MRGMMNSLKLSRRPSSKCRTSYESTPYDRVIHIKTEEGGGKEIFEKITNESGLITDTDCLEEKSCELERNIITDDIVKTEVEKLLVSPVPNVSINKEDKALDYSCQTSKESHHRVAIEYEDDIEEGDYDSDDSEQNDEGDMSSLRSFNGYNEPEFMNANSYTNKEFFQRHYSGSSSSNNFSHIDFDVSPLNLELNPNEISSKDEIGDNNQSVRSLDEYCVSVWLPIVYATINVPFSQVSKFLTNYHLSATQVSIIRKVRRQVKNRMYAQNCRKRRVAHIKNLANELQQIKTEKEKICNVQDELRCKKAKFEKQYTSLFDYVMNVLKDRYQDEDIIEDMEEILYNDWQYAAHKRKLQEENEKLTVEKNNLEAEYNQFFRQVFKVIGERERNYSLNNRNNDMDETVDLQLSNTNIVNELAILNKFYSKNETSELESSVSEVISRTDENKLNDFMDSESSSDSRSANESIRYSIEYKCSFKKNDKTVNIMPEHQKRIADTSVTDQNDEIWTGDLEEGDIDENDEMNQLQKIHFELMEQKQYIQEKYKKLYGNVLQASTMKETELLKEFVDYCISMLIMDGHNLHSCVSGG